MEYKDLTPEQKEIWDLAYEQGFDAGYDACLEEGDDSNDLYNDGYREGVLSERARIQSILGMMFESALNMGQGNKAVQYRQVMDLLKPVDINQSYSDDD